jgi:arylsulfatase A-like enzyme
MYDPADMPLPVHAERPIADLPSPAWPHRARLDGAHRDPDRIRRVRALYHGQVSHVDEAIGRLLAELDALGMREDTIVLFVSDHGDMLGDHGLSQKNVPYEMSVRVPMILHWPGRTAEGGVCDDLVGLTDVLPTFLDGLGLTYPEELPPLPGASLLGRDGGGLAAERDGYFIDYGDRKGRWVGLRTRTHKYALWAAGGKEELYDLSADPNETHNIAAEQADIAAGLRERVVAWERDNGLADSFDGGRFRVFPEEAPPTEDGVRRVMLNEGRWPDNLPEGEQGSAETFAEAFTRAVSKETTLSPGKLSLTDYKARDGVPLAGTPWEEAWRTA